MMLPIHSLWCRPLWTLALDNTEIKVNEGTPRFAGEIGVWSGFFGLWERNVMCETTAPACMWEVPFAGGHALFVQLDTCPSQNLDLPLNRSPLGIDVHLPTQGKLAGWCHLDATEENTWVQVGFEPSTLRLTDKPSPLPDWVKGNFLKVSLLHTSPVKGSCVLTTRTLFNQWGWYNDIILILLRHHSSMVSNDAPANRLKISCTSTYQIPVLHVLSPIAMSK
jgi:hypothetical protein